MGRLLGWARMRLGLCMSGPNGCNRRVAGTWSPAGADWPVRLCDRHRVELARLLGESTLSRWTPLR